MSSAIVDGLERVAARCLEIARDRPPDAAKLLEEERATLQRQRRDLQAVGLGSAWQNAMSAIDAAHRMLGKTP